MEVREAADALGALLDAMACFELDEEDDAVRGLARVGLAYRHEPWDGLEDERPGGLDDDLVVLATVARRCITALGQLGLWSEDTLPAGQRRAVQGAFDLAVSVERRYPDIADCASRHLAVGPGRPFEEQAEAGVARLRDELAQRLDEAGIDGGRWADWLAVVPPAPRGERRVIGLFGRTSAGKTTLLRRLLVEAAPGWRPLADLLGISPRAHTTRVPLVLDLEAGDTEAWWCATGPGGNRGGTFRGDPGQAKGWRELESLLAGASAGQRYGWIRLTVPTRLERPMRLVDLPGTHGFAPGPWRHVPQRLIDGMDALVLPMDRRQFRREEKADCLAVLRAAPSRPVALSLRAAPLGAAVLAAEDFRDRRLAQVLADEPEAVARLATVPVFEVSRHDGAGDGAAALLRWCTDVPALAPAPPDYEALQRAAWDEGDAAARAVLARLGLLRAWMSCLLLGESHA